MTDWDAAFAEARRRLHKAIDRKCQVAMGRKPSTASRSTGQLYGKRGKLAKQ